MTQDRLGPIDTRQHDARRSRRAAQAIIDGPRGALYGPFVPLLRSPELMDHAQRLGEYLRYRSAIGTRLSELAILVTARQWDQQVEWAIHAPIARAGGHRAPTSIDAIAHARRPRGMPEEEAAVYDFSLELNRNKRVSDPTYARRAGAVRRARRGRPDGDQRLLHLPRDGDERGPDVRAPCGDPVRSALPERQ